MKFEANRIQSRRAEINRQTNRNSFNLLLYDGFNENFINSKKNLKHLTEYINKMHILAIKVRFPKTPDILKKFTGGISVHHIKIYSN